MNSQQSTVNNQQSTTHNPLFSFIGDEVDAGYEAAKVVILPIPYEATTTYRRGCERGPAALLEASEQLEYYDEELDWEVCWSVGIHTHAAIADTRTHPNLPSEEMLQVTRETVLNLIRDNKFVIALGGEHSITTGLVQAYCKAQPDSPLTVIQVDAHGDLRHEYEGSIYNHACVMRRIVDMGIPTLQIGIRSLCQEEANLIKANLKKTDLRRANLSDANLSGAKLNGANLSDANLNEVNLDKAILCNTTMPDGPINNRDCATT